MSTGVGPFRSGTSDVETFAAFLREIGATDLSTRKEAVTGRKAPRVDWAMVNRTAIGLSDEEWKAAYAILLDGSQQVAAWSDAMQEALGWQNGRFQADPAQRTARKAKFDRLRTQGNAIVEETLFQLQQQLGKDTFGKLAAYVRQREGGRKSVDRGPIHKGPIETAHAAGSPGQQ